MTYEDADGGSSVKGAWARVTVSCKRKSMWMRCLLKELGFTSDVRASVSLRFRITVTPELCQWIR